MAEERKKTERRYKSAKTTGGRRGQPRPKVQNPGLLFKRIMSYVFKYYKYHFIGVLVCIVAAVLANIYRESAFDPLAVDGDREFFGLCQWSKLRWTNCFFFCREQGDCNFQFKSDHMRKKIRGVLHGLLWAYVLRQVLSSDNLQRTSHS